VLLGELGQLVAFNDLEAGVATEDLVEGVRDALLRQTVLALQVSLLLARVQHNEAWHFTILQVEDRGELGLSARVQAHVVEGDTTLDLAREDLADIIDRLDHTLVARRSLRHHVNHAKDTVPLQADVVSALLAEVGNGLG